MPDILNTDNNISDIKQDNNIQEQQLNDAYLDYCIDAGFDEDQEKKVIQICESELAKIKSEYDAIQWFEKCQKADDEYEGIHDVAEPDITNSPDIKLLMTTVTIDVIASRSFRQTWTPDPCVLLEAEDKFENKDKVEIINKRQENLDYYLREKARIQDLAIPNDRAAGKYGVSILKVFYTHNEEPNKKKKFYRPTPEDSAKFEKKYLKKIMKGEGKEWEEYQQLMSGQGNLVEKIEDDTEVIYHGAKAYRVDWKRFFARPSIKDFRKHNVIGELFTYNWYEIDNEVNSGFWDKKIIDELKERYSNDYYKRDYDFYTFIVRCDKEGNGKFYRYLVTFEATTKKIVRAKYYMYDNIFYVATNIFEKDDSWIGYSITERMQDIIATANSVINSFVAEQDLAHTPIIISNNRKAGDWNIVLGKPNLLPLDPQGMVTQGNLLQYKMEAPSTDRIQFLQWLFNYIAILTGFDPMLLSGSSDPADKRAPAAKSAMKLQASTLRIEDMIITLQKGYSEIARQVERIIVKFPENTNGNYSYYRKGENKELEYSAFEFNVRYIIAGSRMSFDRTQDLAVVMATIEFLTRFFPEVIQDVEVKRSLLRAVLNNSQGTVEKIKDEVLAPMDRIISAKKQSEEQLKSVIDRMGQEGKNPQEISEFLRSMMSGTPGQSNPAPQIARQPQRILNGR